jgi:hypothetical protein
MATSRASLDGSDNGPRGRTLPRGPGFSGEEVKFLFKTVEALLPGSMDEWDALARVYNARFPLATRSGESLRRKFLKLGRTDYAERARRIKVLIQKRLRKEAGFQLPEDLEDDDEEQENGYQAHEQPGEDVSGTDSDAHGNRSDARAEQEREDAEAAAAAERSPTGRPTSSVSSDEPDDANDIDDHVDQDCESASEACSAAVEPVTSSASVVVDSVANGEARPAERNSDTPQQPTVPPLVYRQASASTAEVPTRPATHYALPSDQHPHHPLDRPPSFPLQRLPAPVVAVGQHQRDSFRESSEAPSSESTTLSSPTVVNRWFTLEERRLLLEEQRMAFEQRRLAVEERRLQLLERRMDADTAERNRLLEALQLVMKSGVALHPRTAES